jgi:AcrR family transcriptional regulator
MPRSGDKTRQAILVAANRIVLDQGVEHLTLEAAAREAGISKGGLLHHFPSKEALIAGMIQTYLERFTEDLTASAEKKNAGLAGSWTRAYLEVTFGDNQRTPRMNAGLLAALATDPARLAPVQERFADWLALLDEDGVDPVVATIVRLVADGLWLVELFGLVPPDDDMKGKVMHQLNALIDSHRTDQSPPGRTRRDVFGTILE